MDQTNEQAVEASNLAPIGHNSKCSVVPGNPVNTSFLQVRLPVRNPSGTAPSAWWSAVMVTGGRASRSYPQMG